MKYSIQTVLSTALLPLVELEEKQVVVIDILRATTCMCTALANGAECIIPVATREEARSYSERGYLVASERDGAKLDFAHFGNSPSEFTPERVKEQEIVYSTTNGTRAITSTGRARTVLIGAFTNLTPLAEYLSRQADADLVLVCSGWKGQFNLEDTLFAGALAERLLASGEYSVFDDPTNAALDLWRNAESDLLGYVQRVTHRKRLENIGVLDSFEDCFQVDSTPIVPQFVAGRILPAPAARG